MKHFRKIVWITLFVFVGILTYVAVAFQVDDMTLSKGNVYTFNDGWTLIREDGDKEALDTLPHLGHSTIGEKIVVENTIPMEYAGKTMAFLSADKMFRVWIDDELVYEFGMNDQRSFGHTPGSVYNFIDIPSNLTTGQIRMESTSAYPEYAARYSAITIGDRDVLILQLLKENMFEILCNLAITICAIIFLLLSLIQIASKQKSGGMQFLCGYCLVASMYYFVETKVLHIFYGNQTFYSVMVFLCLMLIPFFITLYYANGILSMYQKRWKVLLGLICINIVVQLVLQLTNTVDFMNMCYFSHGLIGLTVIMVGISYIQRLIQKKEKSVIIGMIALLFMGIGGTVDIVRMYVVAVGDMGKFSRLGSACFAMIMLFQHISLVIKEYSHNMEENAKLLEREMEVVAKKNEELKRASELAEEARQDAIAANAAKGKFLAHMSHEIRTPINAVLGMDTMILRETDDMTVKEYALDIQNAGQNLLSLINDILDFSKIESGKLEIINVEYDFSSLIHDISNMIKAKAEGKNLSLHIYVDENLPSKLFGDDVRIRQILVNLLNNGVKYTQQGSVSLSVKGRVEGRKVVLDFAVEDTGIGIKQEDIHNLFEEFERIEEKRNRNIEGTGLGMNITTQLLSLMGSSLQVESEYGKGSRFYFTLEQQIVDSTPVGNLEERIRNQSQDYSYMAAFTAPEAQLLVVDDNTTNLKVFVNLLKCTKVNVDVADSGAQCLEMIADKYYDLIFLDHMMPGMDGIETLHRMKELENNQCKHTPIIALTANAITGAKEMYLAEGFDAFLPKPINPEKLEQMILKLLPRDLLRFDMDDEDACADAGSDTSSKSSMLMQSNTLDEEELPMVDGIDWNYGLMHLPSRELLLETVTDFRKTLHLEADKLHDFYQKIPTDAAMIEQYRIKVHSMKSSANLIGATVLGGMAKLLENAAREEDVARIMALHDIFMDEWRACGDRLSESFAGGTEDVLPQDTQNEPKDYTVILAYLEMLRGALEELDMDVMDETMAKLEEYSYPSEIQAHITTLSGMVTAMDSDGGEEVIGTLTELVKEKIER